MTIQDSGNRPQPLFALAALLSGAALLISIYVNVSLALSLGLMVSLAVFLVAFRWSHLNTLEKRLLKRQLTTGLLAGFLATVAYDLSRLALVEIGQLSVSPFEAFALFGQLFIGDAPHSIHLMVGTLYHELNGIMFATAYCILLGGRNWKLGILWGLGLEAAMLTVYPGWLNLDAVLAEFIGMSVLGHVTYGMVLGLISQQRLAPYRTKGSL